MGLSLHESVQSIVILNIFKDVRLPITNTDGFCHLIGQPALYIL